MPAHPIIRLTNLSKNYHNGSGSVQVLKAINLEVTPGQIIGYIGPNGAGKSTTVKIICGLLGSYKGTVEVGGFDIRQHPVEVKRMIGYVPEMANIYESVTPIEYFTFLAEMRKMKVTKALDKAGRLMALFDLDNQARQRMGSFSKGMKQKILIISALLHNPDILFMDEPLTGLDANSVITVKAIISQLAAEGKTIFYSSHLMDVVEKVSDRIILLNQGQIIADGAFSDLTDPSQDQSLEELFARLTGNNSENNIKIAEAISD